MSVLNSLQNYIPTGNILHVHKFQKNISEPHAARKGDIEKSNKKLQRILGKWQAGKIYLKVITPIRNPISRNISAFFHYEGVEIVNVFKKFDAINELLNMFLASRHSKKSYENWFNGEIFENFRVDVFSVPFPDAGVARFSSRNFDLLIYRLELSDSVKEAAIKTYLNLDKFELEPHNIGEQKFYAEAYRVFKKFAKLPDSYVNSIHGGKYYRHFYNVE